jgi:hypothetical protein
MGCGCGGSIWTPALTEAAQTASDAPSAPAGVDDPATFWRGPGAPAEAPEEPEPVDADAATA